MVEYRAIRPEEWDEALALWVKVFGVGSWIFQGLHESSPRRKWEHTRVAVDDGRIVSAVDLFLRPTRDVDGSVHWVGGIGSVATLEEARRKGHSGELLLQTIQQMEQEGIAWSYLFTGTNHHYARYGWQNQRLSRKLLKFPEGPLTTSYTVRVFDGDWPLDEMAVLHESFNADKPLTVVRDDKMWHIASKSRLERPERRAWGAYEGERLIGYAVASKGWDSFDLEELAVAPDRLDATTDLLEQFRKELEPWANLPSRSGVAHDERLASYIRACEVAGGAEDDRWSMVRPVDPAWPIERIQALFAHPSAAHYSLDDF